MKGPAEDEYSLIFFVKRLRELVKEKLIKAKIAIEVSFKKDNVYMGKFEKKLNQILVHALL